MISALRLMLVMMLMVGGWPATSVSARPSAPCHDMMGLHHPAVPLPSPTGTPPTGHDQAQCTLACGMCCTDLPQAAGATIAAVQPEYIIWIAARLGAISDQRHAVPVPPPRS